VNTQEYLNDAQSKEFVDSTAYSLLSLSLDCDSEAFEELVDSMRRCRAYRFRPDKGVHPLAKQALWQAVLLAVPSQTERRLAAAAQAMAMYPDLFTRK